MNNSRKRLALFLPALYGGGAERVMLNLAAGIARQGHAVDLVLAQAEGPFLAEVPELVQLVELNSRHLNTSRTVASLPTLVRYLRREQPDAMFSMLHANLIALWARRLAGYPRRLVISEHNTFSHQNLLLPKGYDWLMLQLVKRFYPWADGVVAVSDGVANDLAQVAKIRRDRIRVIYNPIVTEELRAKAKVPLEHPWFKINEPPVVLAVGRLTAQKDFDTLIRAFALVRRTHLARLLILGEGEQRQALEALVKRLNLEQDVGLPGFVPNPYAYMANSSLFVLSSRWEGLPTVLVEALYCGTPLIATDCPSGPREILRDGRFGQLVPVGDANCLAQAIEAGLDGKIPHPQHDSWQPFELTHVVDQYVNMLLGE